MWLLESSRRDVVISSCPVGRHFSVERGIWHRSNLCAASPEDRSGAKDAVRSSRRPVPARFGCGACPSVEGVRSQATDSACRSRAADAAHHCFAPPEDTATARDISVRVPFWLRSRWWSSTLIWTGLGAWPERGWLTISSCPTTPTTCCGVDSLRLTSMTPRIGLSMGSSRAVVLTPR